MERHALVWDLPTRLFHWLLALSFALAWITGDSERWVVWHLMAGYTLLGLIGFRLVWGFLGTRYARFSSFLFGPRAVASYLGSMLIGRPQPHAGHNPAGSLAIFALLGLGAAAGLSGLATYNEWIELDDLHEGLAELMLAVVAIHLGGVLLGSLLHRENLAWSMVTGRKRVREGDGIRRSHAWLAATLVAAVGFGWWQGLSDDPAPAPLARHEASHDDD